MRIILLSIVVSLTAGCSGLVDTIRKNQQKQQVYQQYASKYYASCQKEAFSYYPVAIVKREEPKIITQKPRESFSCTKWGNTVDCRDTTSGGYDELLNSTLKTANMVAGKTDTYDTNEGSRNNHIKSCIDNNLRSDSSYSAAVRRVDYGGGHSSSGASFKRDSFSEFGAGIKSLSPASPADNLNPRKTIYSLNGYEKSDAVYICFYGDKKQHSKTTVALPCYPHGYF
jgi:uncharacterized protein YceK